jgi:carbonic anhydrase/acetyltransferase-like protein (isoleucine patch superfamily)
MNSPPRPAFLAENATLLGDVTVGDRVSIWFGAVVRADKDAISIGDDSNVQDNAVLHTSQGYPVRIGREVSVGHGAILHGCTIGNRVLVGMGAIVLNGARVGEGSLLAAGTVITERAEIPDNSVVIGVPGKILRQTDEKQRQYIIDNARNYVRLAERYAHP